ncbi:MAG: imidazole glycerol phosphate synthase subunit HisH [Candidatus Omnitrophica bacterium]|nr:imidazole glycerol phosphate synthase subunit HisH [Candidatus Omnitrophota bacterium]
MIAIIDYGMGNLGSVAKAFGAIGAKVRVTRFSKDLDRADRIVLPGVGAFRDCMLALKKLKLIPSLMKNIESGKPYLGLCLGMQILFEESAEGGKVKGLGILKGKVKRFTSLKVPQIGWNQIERSQVTSRKSQVNNDCPLLKNIPDGAWMYFVHSYYVAPKDKGIIVATTDYGIDFASMIWKGNIYATQFHPEKSQKIGMKLLENFLNLCW